MTSIFEKEVIYRTTSTNLNILVRKSVTPLVYDNAKRMFRNFNSGLLWSWGLDTEHSVTINDLGDSYNVDHVMTGTNFDLYDLLTFMANNDIIYFGKYIITRD